MRSELVLAARHFPDLVVEVDGGYWNGDLDLGGKKMPVSIFVDSCIQDEVVLKPAAHQLNLLEAMAQTAASAIRDAAAEIGSVAADVLAFHRDEAPDAVPADLNAEPIPKLAGALALVGVGVHSVEPNRYQIVLDFSLGRDRSDQVVAATFTPEVSWTTSVTRAERPSASASPVRPRCAGGRTSPSSGWVRGLVGLLLSTELVRLPTMGRGSCLHLRRGQFEPPGRLIAEDGCALALAMFD